MSKYPVRQAAAIAVGSLLLSGNAMAQASAGCERFKASLAERLPDPSTYTLDAIPASMPLPKGAKVVGNCDGNTVKIIFRRGKQPPIEAGAEAGAPSPAPVAAPAPAPVVVAAAPVQAPPPPPKPAPAPPPPPEPAPTPRVVEAPPIAALPIDTTASEPAAPTETTAEATSWTALATEHWPWLTLGLVPLLLWGVAWVQHRRHYDAAGLPRGPRL